MCPPFSWARGFISSTVLTSEFRWSNSATGGLSEPSNSKSMSCRWAWASFRPIGTSGGSPWARNMPACASGWPFFWPSACGTPFSSVTPPTISVGSGHDADLGYRRASLRTHPLACDRRDDIDGGKQVRDLRDHVRHCIRNPVHGLRTAELAAFHLSSGSRQIGFWDAAAPKRGRPADVLVWLACDLCCRCVRVGWDRHDYFHSVAPSGDHFLLRPGSPVADHLCICDFHR